jgi:hypothetical protein
LPKFIFLFFSFLGAIILRSVDANKYVELRIYPTYFCVDAKTARGRVSLAAMAESRYSLFTAAQFLRR